VNFVIDFILLVMLTACLVEDRLQFDRFEETQLLQGTAELNSHRSLAVLFIPRRCPTG
jgi:hypothetical protein